MISIEKACFWLAERPDSGEPVQLRENRRADITVVGAGFTGLWTAYFLKQLSPEKEIAIVEQGVTGYGGSGRNAGIVGASIDHSHSLAVRHFGEAEAARLARVGVSNIDELAHFAADCDFERTGQLQVALSRKHIEECRQNIEVAERLGIEGYRFLDEEQVRAEINSPLYKGAAFVPGGGVINPVKLVNKLRLLLVESGVRVFERSKVADIKDGCVHGEKGSIKSPRVVLATDSYSHHLFPQLLQLFIPLYDYVLVSEPLSKEQHEAIGWKNRQGVVDCRNFFNYYRLTADNRILWGTSEANYYPHNRVDETCDHSEDHYASLRASFSRHFPQIKELRFPYQWGGPIASTTRLTPFFGSLDGGKVIYALGYTGHGIGSTRVAGKILAHMALAKEHELLSLLMVRNKPFPYPPEPLRGLSVSAVTDSLRKVDGGERPGMLLKLLDAFGIGFSS